MRWAALAVALAAAPASAAAQAVEPPRLTLLYQNFPNPFPVAGDMITCVWYDLARASDVSLQILDIRGNIVRTLVPGPHLATRQSRGRYGRATGDLPNGSGCDDRLTWDGTASDGRVVPAGVYLLRLRADGEDVVRRILFLGR